MLYDRFFNREYNLIVRQKGQTIFETNTLDIKFTIDRYRNTDKCESRISVLGLDRDKISSIAKIARAVFSKAQEMQIEIELCAGYKGNCSLIYKGYVISADVEAPPNMWLNMRCVNYYSMGFKPVSISIDARNSPRMTYSDLAVLVCSRLGLGLPDRSAYHPSSKESDRVDTRKPFVGVFTREKALSALYYMNSDKWIIYYDMGRVYIADKKPDPKTAKKLVLDENNGLLSVSGVTFSGCNVVTLLQDSDPTVCMAEVKSEYNIGANGGTWTILGKKLEGHYRGNKWQTTFNLYLGGQKI